MLVKLPTRESTLLNSFGPLPRDGEGADAAAAQAGDRPARRVVAQLHRLLDLGQDLLEQETRVLIGERVVLEAAIGAVVGEDCRA